MVSRTIERLSQFQCAGYHSSGCNNGTVLAIPYPFVPAPLQPVIFSVERLVINFHYWGICTWHDHEMIALVLCDPHYCSIRLVCVGWRYDILAVDSICQCYVIYRLV